MKTAGQFQELLTQHLIIGGGLVNAAKAGDTAKADEVRKKWYQNADEIAAFLASVNPCWSEAKWKQMMYSRLDMTEKEAALRLQGNFAADIQMFDEIEKEAMAMANYMFCGLVRCRAR